jgi:hypothetical protein
LFYAIERILQAVYTQSLQSELNCCGGANGRNPEQERRSKASSSAWQILKVAFLFLILG